MTEILGRLARYTSSRIEVTTPMMSPGSTSSVITPSRVTIPSQNSRGTSV